MKATFLPAAMPNSAKRIPLGLVLAVAVMFPHYDAMANPITLNLGSAADSAVLAGAGITVTGPTTITGDMGTFPTPSITGFANVTLHGANNADNAVTQLAKIDLVTAYNDAAGRANNATYTGGFDLVGLTLNSGVYNDGSSLFLSGKLTLDAQNNPDAVWIFKTGSTLITASDSMVTLINGAQPCNVFWQVGSSATLGTGTDFVGNILAFTSITLNTGATMDGRALALNGAVTLDTNTIAKSVCDTGDTGNTGDTGDTGDTGRKPVPDGGNTLLMIGSVLTLLAFGRRFVFPA